MKNFKKLTMYNENIKTTASNSTDPLLGLDNVISWVAVEKKMPESGERVLLYSPKSGVGEGAWISAKGHFEQWRWNSIKNDVTHWAELPKPPCV